MAAEMYTDWTPYLDNISNSTSNPLIAMIQQTSIATNYLPATIILAAIWIIIFGALIMRQTHPSSAFTAASIAHLVLCILIYPLGILNHIHFIISLIMPCFGVLSMYLASR